ncbi:hypothetical protein [Sphingosinicella sp. BN140058]|uniref:hypothetical protein n=1 Tax=Sphingosinicella sp. BN140058 TaxID=1892855 RepID=UPI00101037D7|nr:hypothetical protein [Sphingosinicella sp. BN140058]QAY79212.1 hypothetical protein ETR14_23725 [Sphingosinicella sp. BN140058]
MYENRDPSGLRLPRRDFLHAVSAGLVAAPLAGTALSRQPERGGDVDLAARAHDWDWLKGNWEVWHRRLKDRLAGSNEWQEFGGKSALWLALGGLATIDDNIVDIPSGSYRGLTVRTFDPVTASWSIWWLDGRNPERIDPPVRGRFGTDSATFVGPDTYNGQPVTVRFRWLDIHSRRPHWEQAFSPDEGRTWEVNWENFFTRTAALATPLTLFETRNRDFDFLVGKWLVRHRRLTQRLAGSDSWETFSGTLENWPVLGGRANIGDNLFAKAHSARRGIGLRVFDPKAQQWVSWWIDGADPSAIGNPLRGRFEGDTGTFFGDDVQNGRPVRTRVTWSRVSPNSARWEQAMSTDGGTTWETNWISDLQRRV